jgi:hypothetical protein
MELVIASHKADRGLMAAILGKVIKIPIIRRHFAKGQPNCSNDNILGYGDNE